MVAFASMAAPAREYSDCLFMRYGGRVVREVTDAVAAFAVNDRGTERHPRPHKDWGATHELWTGGGGRLCSHRLNSQRDFTPCPSRAAEVICANSRTPSRASPPTQGDLKAAEQIRGDRLTAAESRQRSALPLDWGREWGEAYPAGLTPARPNKRESRRELPWRNRTGDRALGAIGARNRRHPFREDTPAGDDLGRPGRLIRRRQEAKRSALSQIWGRNGAEVEILGPSGGRTEVSERRTAAATPTGRNYQKDRRFERATLSLLRRRPDREPARANERQPWRKAPQGKPSQPIARAEVFCCLSESPGEPGEEILIWIRTRLVAAWTSGAGDLLVFAG